MCLFLVIALPYILFLCIKVFFLITLLFWSEISPQEFPLMKTMLG